MKQFILIALALQLFECEVLFAQQVDARNYVVGSYDATINEARIAEIRVWHYWLKNRGRLGAKTRYVAIVAASVMPGDVVQLMWENMINAQTGSAFLLPAEWNPGRMRCVMIYDTENSRFVSQHGYLVIETPHRGKLARFGDYIAIYIDTGSSFL
ncbi:MAG TPA: hypothetical protein VE860_23770 [Chthoniobacterales bacterium]|jgi:hypothetical protein|nr:hypothetical protein [Chthoniobacterales bacterium]